LTVTGLGTLTNGLLKRHIRNQLLSKRAGKTLLTGALVSILRHFWAKGKTCCLRGQQINYLSFRIEPIDKVEKGQGYFIDITKLIDSTLVLTTKLDKYTKIQDAETVPIRTSEK
jgi:hypothetical protein